MEDAKNECKNLKLCKGVLDINCNGQQNYTICLKFATTPSDDKIESCLYEKHNIGRQYAGYYCNVFHISYSLYKVQYTSKNLLYMFIENGVWGLWSEWDPCPATCGGADQRRSRVCNFPDPENKGDDCDVDESRGIESRRCGEASCPGNSNLL